MSHMTDIIIKGTMIGDFNVGKSSIFQRYIENKLEPNPTIGVDFNTKKHVVNGLNVKMHLWDTAGQERFRSIIKSYVRNVYVFFLVFDVTQRESYTNLPYWISFIKSHSTGKHIIILIANKTEVPYAQWQVKREDIQNFAQAKHLGTVFFVSANDNAHVLTTQRHSVHQMFDIVIHHVCKSVMCSNTHTHQNGIIDKRLVHTGQNKEMHTPPGTPPTSPTSREVMTIFGFKQYKTEKCEPLKHIYPCC